jgi:hypothetical protein
VSDTPYRIVNSEELRNQFVALLNIAELEGRYEAVRDAATDAFDQLRTEPTSVGEGAGILEHSGMQLRRLMLSPLTIEYAVAEERRAVVLKSIVLWPL